MQSEWYEWDDDKAASNLENHGVSFAKATEVFDDPLSYTFDDDDHSNGEHREITIGYTMFYDVLVVSHTMRGERIRVISARHADRAERRKFMNKEYDRIRDDDDLRPHYDFDYSKGVRGKYYNPKNTTTIMVRLDEDVARHFYNAQLLNDALRALIAEGRAPEPRNE